jgi:hypothetical protein
MCQQKILAFDDRNQRKIEKVVTMKEPNRAIKTEKLARFLRRASFPIILIDQAHFAFLGADFVLRRLN